MSRGPGWLERAIEQTFVKYPWEEFTVTQLWWAASSRRRPIERGSELTPPTAAQRRSVLRAAHAVLRHRCSDWCATPTAGRLVFHRRDVPLRRPECGDTAATQASSRPAPSGSTHASATPPDIIERIKTEAYPDPAGLASVVALAAPPAANEADFTIAVRETIAELWIDLHYEREPARAPARAPSPFPDAITWLRNNRSALAAAADKDARDPEREPDFVDGEMRVAAAEAVLATLDRWAQQAIAAAKPAKPGRPSQQSVHNAIGRLLDIWIKAHGKRPGLISKRKQTTQGIFLDFVRDTLGSTLLKYGIKMDMERAVRTALYPKNVLLWMKLNYLRVLKNP
jgi:hypothetical protein